ncbi:MAG: excinuclease ABC subunit UvrC [bacterium]
MATLPNLEEKLKLVPARPGVYLMKDAGGRVIYVGKAAALRNRVRQYFQDSSHLESPRIRYLMSKIADFDVVACENEVEALLLEVNLIKRHQPPYNVRMADDKAFPYVKITNEAFPKISMTRRVLRDGAKYFGPYPYHEPKLVRRTIRTIRKLFKIRSCNIEITRDLPRPCLDYYIGLCTAPCVSWGATPEHYNDQVRQATLFLEGKHESVLDELRVEMDRAAQAMEFERAAQLRDQIQAMEAIYEKQRAASVGLEDRDVMAIAQAGDLACVQILFVRAGRLQGQEHFVLENTRGVSRAEALGEFVKQYYQDAPGVPREVVLQEPIEDMSVIAEWLSQKRMTKVDVIVPQRGARERLVEMAAENAALFLQHERARRSGLEGAAIKELQEILNLENPPFRIEAYDVSNFQAGETVGSMVVFEGGRPLKRDYRRFKMKWAEGPNDYAMFQEMLHRRFALGREEQEKLDRDELARVKWSVLPDLVLIDGGRGQLNAALDVLFEYNHMIPAVGLAKKEELVVTVADPEPVALPRDSHALQLLQRIRDEAHRFANTYHQKLRQRKVVFSALDEIQGIGEKRKRDLIRHFGSVRQIRQASVEQIAGVIGPKTAQKVSDYLQQHPDVRYKDEAVR